MKKSSTVKTKVEYFERKEIDRAFKSCGAMCERAQEMDNKIYIVVADTYDGEYGEKITCLYADKDIKKCIDYVEAHIDIHLSASYMCAKEVDFEHEPPYPEFIKAIVIGEEQNVLLGGYIE